MSQEGAILELVTKPVDEFKEDDQSITSLFDSMATFARGAAGAHGKKLADVATANTGAYNYVGFPNRTVANPALRKTTPHPNGSIQATHGGKLERLPDLLDLQSNPSGAAATPAVAPVAPQGSGAPAAPAPPAPKASAGGAAQKVLAEARQKAGTVSSQLLAQFPSKGLLPRFLTRDKVAFKNQAELGDVHGPTILLLNYLLAGGRDLGFGWGKNQVGQLFYKSRLSEVRTKIGGRQNQLLKKEGTTVADLIIKASGRVDADYVIKGRANMASGTISVLDGMPTCRDWVTDVLAGNGDAAFDALKNEYSDSIKPEKIGPKRNHDMAVIMENRQLGKLVQPKVSALSSALTAKGTKPDDWAEIAVKLAQMLRVINGKGAPDLDNIRALLKS